MIPFRGSLDEGAIFGGLFLGLSFQVGLKDVVASSGRGLMPTGQVCSTELDDIVTTWGL